MTLISNQKRPRLNEVVPSRPPFSYDSGMIGAITPTRLSSILRSLGAGDINEAMSFFDEMEEKDLHLGAVMQTRALAVASRKRDVLPASDNKEDIKLADFVREVFEALPGKQSAIVSLVSAVSHGFSIAEIIWEIADGQIIATEILPRPQKLFTYVDPDDMARPLLFPRYLDPDNRNGIALPRDKFIFHRPLTGKNVLNAGLYRGLAWYYLFTNFAIKDWMTYLDLYGVPLRLGKYSSNADDSSKDALKRAVRDLGSDSAAVISEDTTIEFVQAAIKGDNNIFQNAAEFFDRQKSKRILGQTLTTEGGGKSGGAYALGEVHDRVRKDIVAHDAMALDETLSKDFIRPLINFNFGPQKRYPRIETVLTSEAESDRKLDRIEKLVKLGANIPVREAARLAGLSLSGDLDKHLSTNS